MIAQILLMVAFPAFLAMAAACDVASFTIPNRLTLALAVLFPAFGLAAGFAPSVFAFHVAAGLIALIASFTLFSFGLIGGGDAKLFAAVALWLGWHDLLAYAVVASLLGGVLTMSLLGLRQLPMPAGFVRWDWIQKLCAKNSGIPYGVALAAGALVILPHAEILHLAAAS